MLNNKKLKNNNIVIMNFTGVYENQEFYQDLGAVWLELGDPSKSTDEYIIIHSIISTYFVANRLSKLLHNYFPITINPATRTILTYPA